MLQYVIDIRILERVAYLKQRNTLTTNLVLSIHVCGNFSEVVLSFAIADNPNCSFSIVTYFWAV